jgi:hypothetical protein
LAASRKTNLSIPKHLHGKKKPGVRFWTKVENNGKGRLRTYLVPLAILLFKVGICVESSLCLRWLGEILASHCLKELPSVAALTYAALLSAGDSILAI